MQSGLYFEYYAKDGKLKSRLKISMYVYQLISWWCIVICSKVLLAVFQLSCHSWLEDFGDAILSPFKENPKLKLVVVMMFFPIVLNSIQFWVQDNFLKAKKEIYPQLEMPQNNQMEYVLPDNNYENGENIENLDKEHKSGQDMRIDFNDHNEINNFNKQEIFDESKVDRKDNRNSKDSISKDKTGNYNSHNNSKNNYDFDFFGVHDKNNIKGIEEALHRNKHSKQ